MDTEIITFNIIETGTLKFWYSKSPIKLNNIDIYKIIKSKKVSFNEKGFKYFTGYKHDEEVKPLCILLPKMISV